MPDPYRPAAQRSRSLVAQHDQSLASEPDLSRPALLGADRSQLEARAGRGRGSEV
jgi:hypothetical protein